MVKSDLYPYTFIKKLDAQQKSQDMYKNSTYVRSTLISSYGWDTAMNFICQNNKYSEDSEDGYKLAIIKNYQEDCQNFANIGTGNKTKTGKYDQDCYSNIYDFLGNIYEWTTEYSNDATYESVFRGTGYNISTSRYTSLRDYSTSDLTYTSRGFRVQLYLQ